VKDLANYFTKQFETQNGAIASRSPLLIERRAYSEPAEYVHQPQGVHQPDRCQDRVGSWHGQCRENEEMIQQDRRAPDQRNDRRRVKVVEKEQRWKADTNNRCRVKVVEDTQSLRTVCPQDPILITRRDLDNVVDIVNANSNTFPAEQGKGGEETSDTEEQASKLVVVEEKWTGSPHSSQSHKELRHCRSDSLKLGHRHIL
jgi:hypothetical protein